MSWTTAARRRAEGKCYDCEAPAAPQRTYCHVHLARIRIQNHRTYDANLMPAHAALLQAHRATVAASLVHARPEAPPIPTGPLMGCCGQWHPITHLPMVMPCCGRIRLVWRVGDAPDCLDKRSLCQRRYPVQHCPAEDVHGTLDGSPVVFLSCTHTPQKIWL